MLVADDPRALLTADWDALAVAEAPQPLERSRRAVRSSQRTLRQRSHDVAVTATAPEARLLVVEDEPNIRELLATSLRFAGFEVPLAGDGAERAEAGRRAPARPRACST